MKFLGGIRASLLYGKAISKFYQKKFGDAAHLFERAYKLSPGDEKKELIDSYLGQCYLALERYNEAEVLLSRAYEIYSDKMGAITDSFERREIINMLKALSNVLEKIGKIERSRKIALEISEMERKA